MRGKQQNGLITWSGVVMVSFWKCDEKCPMKRMGGEASFMQTPPHNQKRIDAPTKTNQPFRSLFITRWREEEKKLKKNFVINVKKKLFGEYKISTHRIRRVQNKTNKKHYTPIRALVAHECS